MTDFVIIHLDVAGNNLVGDVKQNPTTFSEGAVTSDNLIPRKMNLGICDVSLEPGFSECNYGKATFSIVLRVVPGL